MIEALLLVLAALIAYDIRANAKRFDEVMRGLENKEAPVIHITPDETGPVPIAPRSKRSVRKLIELRLERALNMEK